MHSEYFAKGTRGEFRGDFTRDSFDPYRHFSRVLMQQGRVQIDADWNEQSSIFVHTLRALAVDIMGPHAAATGLNKQPGLGFRIDVDEETGSFLIHQGRYYVDGILCENSENIGYLAQPHVPLHSAENQLPEGQFLVYLDVWERHLGFVEDDYMREKALGGPDTATRAQIIWQVKTVSRDSLPDLDGEPVIFKNQHQVFLDALDFAGIRLPGTGLLRARAQRGEDDNEPCLTAPKASYRGAENQLYRVEVHRGGVAAADTNDVLAQPTFKWSRENSSVVFPIIGVTPDSDTNTILVSLEHLGRDDRLSLKPNDWVEFFDDETVLRNREDELRPVLSVDADTATVELGGTFVADVDLNFDNHPYLRRWDQRNGDKNGVLIQEGIGDSDWIALEDSVEVQFPGSDDNTPVIYRRGDYWLIPARTVTGDVEWPGPIDAPEAVLAQGVDHHYAPLAIVSIDAANGTQITTDLRRKLKTSWS